MKLRVRAVSKSVCPGYLLVAMLGASGVQAVSAESSDWYFSGAIGVGFTSDADFSGTVTPPGGAQTVEIDFDSAVKLGGSVGRSLGSLGSQRIVPRVEAALSFQNSDADRIDFSGNGPGDENNVGGDLSRVLLMANVFLDVDTNSAFTPYIGGGIGAAFTDVDIAYGGAVGATPPVSFDDSDTNFAAQGIVGTSVALSSKTSLFVDGRYTRIFDVSGSRTNPGGLTGTIEDDVSDVSVNLGLRVSF